MVSTFQLLNPSDTAILPFDKLPPPLKPWRAGRTGESLSQRDFLRYETNAVPEVLEGTMTAENTGGYHFVE